MESIIFWLKKGCLRETAVFCRNCVAFFRMKQTGLEKKAVFVIGRKLLVACMKKCCRKFVVFVLGMCGDCAGISLKLGPIFPLISFQKPRKTGPT